MTLNAELGRKPYVYIKVVLHYCPLTYGTGACSANLALPKCYNTLKTCKALASYATAMVEPSGKVYTFGSADQLVRGSIDVIPSIQNVKFAPTKIEDQGGLGARAAVTVSLTDTTHNDIGVDKYDTSRGGADMLTKGTFWSRLLARNPNYISRSLILYTGFLSANDTIAGGEFKTQYYVIESISGPDGNGNVQIIAKDVLNLLDDDRAKVPKIRIASLSAAINMSDVTMYLKDSVIATFRTSGYLVVDNEVIRYTSISTSAPDNVTINIAERGAFGTIPAAHGVNIKVQPGYALETSPGVPIRIDYALQDLLMSAGVPSTLLDIAGWAVEANQWCDNVRLYGIVPAPTGIRSLVKDICRQANVYIWYDTREQKVKFRVNRPALADEITPLNDSANILEGSFKQSSVSAKRLSRVFYYYGIKDPTQKFTEPSNYLGQYIQIDAEAESSLGYGVEQSLSIFAPYFRVADESIVANMAARLLNKFRNPPQQFTFNIDAKDRDLWTGNFVSIRARNVVSIDGSPTAITAEILQAVENRDGDQIALMVQSSQGAGRYAIIIADGSPDYASAVVLDPSGYISSDPQSSSFMPNGDQPYLMS